MNNEDYWEAAEAAQHEMEEVAKAEQAESDAATALAEQEAIQFAEAQTEAQAEEDFFRKKTARYTITEEPLTPQAINKLIARIDEEFSKENPEDDGDFVKPGVP